MSTFSSRASTPSSVRTVITETSENTQTTDPGTFIGAKSKEEELDQTSTVTQNRIASPSFPISLRGNFFDDQFFTSMQNDYKSAVDKILRSRNMAYADHERMNAYKVFRQDDLKDDNQAISIKDDGENHKVSVINWIL